MGFENGPILATTCSSYTWALRGIMVVMIIVICKQGNEFSESIYIPEKIQLRFRPSLIKSFNDTLHFHLLYYRL